MVQLYKYDLFKNDVLEKEGLSIEEVALFLESSTSTVRNACDFDYPLKGYTIKKLYKNENYGFAQKFAEEWDSICEELKRKHAKKIKEIKIVKAIER